MKTIKSVIILISLFAFSCFGGCTTTVPSQTSQIKDEQIKAVMTSFATAFSRNSYVDLDDVLSKHFSSDLVLRYDVPTRGGRLVNNMPLSDLKYGLRMVIGATIENNARYMDIKIEMAPNRKSSRVTASLIETIQMDLKAATMFFPYLFTGNSASAGKTQVTFSRETVDIMVFEYRNGQLIVTDWQAKVVKAELI